MCWKSAQGRIVEMYKNRKLSIMVHFGEVDAGENT